MTTRRAFSSCASGIRAMRSAILRYVLFLQLGRGGGGHSLLLPNPRRPSPPQTHIFAAWRISSRTSRVNSLSEAEAAVHAPPRQGQSTQHPRRPHRPRHLLHARRSPRRTRGLRRGAPPGGPRTLDARDQPDRDPEGDRRDEEAEEELHPRTPSLLARPPPICPRPRAGSKLKPAGRSVRHGPRLVVSPPLEPAPEVELGP